MNHKIKPRLLKPVSLAVALMTAGGLAANAQAVEEAAYLEEITVTAQKRAESIQDVPITITSFQGDDLVDLGITESDQIGLFVPGLEIGTPSGEGSQLTVFLRGAGLSDFNSNNAGPIAVYADEVYLSSPGLTTFDLFDIERVEVLKGPQGTIYGRNTTGGAIKFISNKPTEELSGRVRVRAENFGTTAVEGAVSGALSDKVRGRVAFIKNDSDGYGTNLLDNTDTNGVDSQSYRAFLDIDANENLSFRLNVHGGEINSPSAATSPLGLTSDGSTRCPVPAIVAGQCVNALGYRAPSNVFEGSYNNIQDTKLESTGGYFQADWTSGNLTITSVTAYDELERDLFEETDGSPNSLLEIAFGVDSETFAQELRANYVGDNFEWLAGAYYLSEDLNQDQTIDLFRDLRVFTGGFSDPTGSVTGAPILFARSLNTQEIDTFALFGQFTYDLNDKLSLTVGGRYTDEDRDFSARGQLEDVQTFGPNPLIVYDAPDLNFSDSEFSWRIAMDYTVSDDMLLYANAARGFKSGGFNGGFLSLNPAESVRQLQPFDSEFVTSYELGMKSDHLGGRLRFNAALFYNDFEDLQVFAQINTNSTPLLVLDNASDAEAYGLEIDLSLVPAQGWLLSLTGAFMDSELNSFVPGSVSGNELGNTPNTSFTASIGYEHNLANGDIIAVQGTTSYRDATANSNEAFVGENDYTLTNLRASYLSDANWAVSLFVNNLSDEQYITASSNLSDFGFIQRFFSEPRTYGLELSYDFQ